MKTEDGFYNGGEIGGSFIRLSDFSGLERVREDHTVGDIPNPGTFEGVVDLVKRYVKGREKTLDKKCLGVGLTVAGKLNEDRTEVVLAGKLSDSWVGKPILDIFRNELGCPVSLGNDMEAANIADSTTGFGVGKSFASIGIGSGIGGAVSYLRNGKRLIFPTEPGHMELNQHGNRRCDCGGMNHWEAYCGGLKTEQYYGRKVRDLTPTQWESWKSFFVQGLYNYLLLHPVPLVVLSGGVSVDLEPRFGEIEALLAEKLGPSTPQLRLSFFGKSAGTVGAVRLLARDAKVKKPSKKRHRT